MPLPKLTLRADKYFTAPRLKLCESNDCEFTKGFACRFSEITIGEDGVCQDYKKYVEDEKERAR